MWNRRQFIKAIGAAGTALMVPFQRLGTAQASSPSGEDLPSGAELYGGFVLLREGTPVPKMVVQPKLPPPNMCGVGVDEGGLKPNAVMESFATVADLMKKVDFPVYTLGKLPDGLRQACAFTIRHETGEIYGVSLGFESYNVKNDYWETTVSLWIQPDFPRPFPLWFNEPVELSGPAVTLDKVDVLDLPGIRVATPAGDVYHWIEKDIFYTFALQFYPVEHAAASLLNLLAFAK